MNHPLKNSTSTHYGDTINDMEKILSVAAMIGFCEGNNFKYKDRLGKKSLLNGLILQVVELWYKGRDKELKQFKEEHLEQVKRSDLAKIKTYEDYLSVLKVLAHRGHAKLTVSHAYDIEGIVWDKV